MGPGECRLNCGVNLNGEAEIKFPALTTLEAEYLALGCAWLGSEGGLVWPEAAGECGA